MSYADDMGFYAYDEDDYYPDMNEVMMRQIQGYYHYNKSIGMVDVRKIDSTYAFNLYNWYLRKAKDDEQKEVMKQSVMLKELESKFYKRGDL